MNRRHLTVLAALIVACAAQRSPYAGRRPVGYPEMEIPSTTTLASGLGNRFGNENRTPTTTQRLPIEARGDAELVSRLSKLPIDQQPFWFINWQALEAHRQKAITYDLRPSSFVDPNNMNNQFLSDPPNFRPVQQPNVMQNNQRNALPTMIN